MEATTTETLHDLKAELSGIRSRVEQAAAADDVVSWMEARMREDALPLLLRAARTAPLKERLARLDAEMDRLVEEREKAMWEEPPPAPASMRGTVTKHMRRQRILDGLAARESQASRERRDVLKAIESIEAGEEAS